MVVKGKETIIKFGTYTMTEAGKIEDTPSDIFKDYDYLFVPAQNNVDEMLKSMEAKSN